MPLVPQPLIDAAAARLALAHRCRKFVGLHASAAGGPHNAVANALKHGGTAFALFLRSQRKWESPPLPPDEPAKFRAALAMAGLQPRHVLPHGSYLVNLGHADPAKQAQSRAVFVDDLRRCEALGIELYNFHPGAPAGSCTNAEAAAHVADAINLAHAQTSSVVCVLETMCGSGSGLCGRFEDLAAIIRGESERRAQTLACPRCLTFGVGATVRTEPAAVKDKARVGVCMDTCHMFAAGYDVSTAAGFDAVLREFDRVVGLQYLRAVHLNGSKTPFGSKRDRHENLGKGFLGLDCFRFIMNDDRFNDMPLVLGATAPGPPRGAQQRWR